jgi:hypothetical protein
MRALARAGVAAVVLGCGGVAACSGTSNSTVGQDAAADGSSTVDATTDAYEAGVADGSTDATVDTSVETSVETSVDTSVEASADATVDALDAQLDAGADAVTDAGQLIPEDAPADAAVDGPSLCSQTPFLFCSGFEQSILNEWTAINSLNGQAGLDTTHVYRGHYALHVNTYPVTDAGTLAYGFVEKFGPGLYPTHFFTRFFFYMPSPAPTFGFNIVDLQQNGGSYAGLELRVDNSQLDQLTWATTADQRWQSDAGLPFDQWACFEIEVDTVAETQHVYLDDVEVTGLAQVNLALPQLGNASLGLGFNQPPPQGSFDAWIDEVAIDTARVGCQK